MTQPQSEGHTSKALTENQFLPVLQKRILLSLSENQPQSRYSMVKIISGHYKSVWNAFDSLVEKRIITEIDANTYRGREHPMFWLTSGGVFIALAEGIKPKVLLNKTLEIYPEEQLLQFLVDVSTIFGNDMFKIAYQMFLKKGKLEKGDAYALLIAQLQNDLSLDQIKALINIMKKYPQQFRDFKEQTIQTIEKLKRAELFLKEALES